MTDAVGAPVPVQQMDHEKQADGSTQKALDASTSPLVHASDNAEAATWKPGEQGSGDYPSGLPLFFIVVALILSIFLASLDLVCQTNTVSVL